MFHPVCTTSKHSVSWVLTDSHGPSRHMVDASQMTPTRVTLVLGSSQLLFRLLLIFILAKLYSGSLQGKAIDCYKIIDQTFEVVDNKTRNWFNLYINQMVIKLNQNPSLSVSWEGLVYGYAYCDTNEDWSQCPIRGWMIHQREGLIKSNIIFLGWH
jgi:hypothetical protein